MPSTKDDRYVSTALSLRTLCRKSAASVMPLPLAVDSNSSRFTLLVVKPFALAHFAEGGLNLNPANVSLGKNKNPSLPQVLHLLGFANGSPFFLVLRMYPEPPQSLHCWATVRYSRSVPCSTI